MNKEDVFWLILWAIVAVFVICAIRGCNTLVVEENRHSEVMADKGFEYHGGGWINRQYRLCKEPEK